MKRKNCNKCRACYIDYNLNRQTACKLGYNLEEGPQYILNGPNFQNGFSTLYPTDKCPKPITINEINCSEIMDCEIENVHKFIKQKNENEKRYYG